MAQASSIGAIFNQRTPTGLPNSTNNYSTRKDLFKSQLNSIEKPQTQTVSQYDKPVKDTQHIAAIHQVADVLFEELGDLVNEQWRRWYCGMFNQLGSVKVLELAAVARKDGKNKQRYFSYLLKQTMEAR